MIMKKSKFKFRVRIKKKVIILIGPQVNMEKFNIVTYSLMIWWKSFALTYWLLLRDCKETSWLLITSISWMTDVMTCRLIDWISFWSDEIRFDRSTIVSDSWLNSSSNDLAESPLSQSHYLEWVIVIWLLIDCRITIYYRIRCLSGNSNFRRRRYRIIVLKHSSWFTDYVNDWTD